MEPKRRKRTKNVCYKLKTKKKRAGIHVCPSSVVFFRENSSAYWFLSRPTNQPSSSCASCVALFAYTCLGLAKSSTPLFCGSFSYRDRRQSSGCFLPLLLSTRRWLGLLTLFRNRLVRRPWNSILRRKSLGCTISTWAPPSYVAQLLMLCFSAVTSSRWCVLHKHGSKCRWMNFQFGLPACPPAWAVSFFHIIFCCGPSSQSPQQFNSPDVDSMFVNFDGHNKKFV